MMDFYHFTGYHLETCDRAIPSGCSVLVHPVREE